MICKSCGVDASSEAFYESNKTRCKECIKASVIANRLAKIEYYRAYDNMRASQPHRVAARKEYMKTDAGKAAHQKALRKNIATHPDQAKARYAVSNAVRDGRLKKTPCMVCGALEVEGHHPDYSRPLDVVWLCMLHHKQAHGLMEDYKEAA
jgi:hypothetical protein